jgi:DNA replication and repair protein RecF
VWLRQLRLENLRAFASLELDLDRGWNVFTGANGAGKTTLLEAAFLLSHGRSFRSGPRDVLVRRGARGYSVYGRVERNGGSVRVGLSRIDGVLEARVAGEPASTTELLRETAVVCFEPGSHELISGPSEGRRRFLDWGVFHVEPNFVPVWRSYQRALKQRNALLRAGAGTDGVDAWDLELARSGAELTAMRARYMARFEPVVVESLAELLPELGSARMTFESGWRGEADPLEVLAGARDEDLRRGHTTRGPHRADWSVAFAEAPRREHLSRGQEKLCALGCVMGQARAFSAERGEWPVVCVDDLGSELDGPHQEALVRTLLAAEAQCLITGTEEPRAIRAANLATARFHVEPARVIRLL